MPKPEMVPLVAVKRMKYATRAIMPGDEFSAKPTDARILIALKKAREPERQIGSIPAPPARVAARLQQLDHDDGEPGGSKSAPTTDDLAPLRAEYVEKIGRRPLNGWDADELRRRIAEHAAS